MTEPAFARTCSAIRSLGQDPGPAGCRKLVNREGWRIRVGDYRVVCQVDDGARSVLILRAGHRRDIHS